MNDTFFATTDWCLFLSMSFILLLFHNSDDVTGLFPRKHCTLPTTLEIGKIHNWLHFPKYKFTENILQKTLEVAFPSPYILKISGVACPQISLLWAAFGTTTFLPRVRTPTKSHATPVKKIYIKFSLRAYRGLCGLFAAASCRHSSDYGQQ